jgi:hypothetical protein
MWQLIAPALDPVEHFRQRTANIEHLHYGSTELLAQRKTVKKKIVIFETTNG